MLGNKVANELQVERLDNGALNGLRGLLSFYVALEHVIHETCPWCKGIDPNTNFYGNVHMPLFYLLSGFTLALAYGQTMWKECFIGRKTTKSITLDMENQNQEAKAFAYGTFYWNRLARILPVYYLGTILSMYIWINKTQLIRNDLLGYIENSNDIK